MRQVRQGDTVTVQYIGTLDNGRIFDSTDEAPLSFTIGASQVFAALENQVVGMRVGEARNFVIPASEAYGPRLADNIITLGRERFPADRELRVGQKLSLEFASGSSRLMLITEVSETQVTLDGNHPLAGLDLTFALRLDAID